MEGLSALHVVIFLVCLILAAFFCSAETAFIGLQKMRLQHLVHSNSPKADRVARIMAQPERFLSTILLGVNLSETAVATVGTIMAISLWGEELGAAIAVIIVTAATMILAELIPKSIAATHGEKLALAYVRPIELVTLFFHPFVRALGPIGRRFTRMVGEVEVKPIVSEEEIRTAISVGEKEGVVTEAEADMLRNVFEFGDQPVREVMTPRTEFVWIEQGTKMADFLSIYAQTPHFRFPVYKENIDNVIGILSIRDVLMAQANASLDSESPIDELIRPTCFVPESKRVGGLFAEMRDGNYHLAIVVDEFGGTAGTVTIEQLAEEIMGRIGNELAGVGRDFETISRNIFQIDGGMRVEEANEELALDLPDGDYETIAGFVLSRLGHIPVEGEQLKHNNLKLVVTEMRGKKIQKVLVTKEEDAAIEA